MALINKEQFTKQLGQFIRTKRERMNLTLEDVAQRTGLDDKHLGRVERGEKTLSSHSLTLILLGLELDYNEFLNAVREIHPDY